MAFHVKSDDDSSNCSSSSTTSEHVQQLLQLWRHYTKILPIDDITVKNIASDICCLLAKTNSLEALSVFLNELPTSTAYWKNENVLRARVQVALFQNATETAKKILKENHFSKPDQLIELWDKAHYIEEEKRTGKTLTALSRFRVRRRNPPPQTICPTGVRKSSSLPRESTGYLKRWLMAHRHDPYPSVNEKQHLAKVSGLTISQVKTWFANARRRSKNHEDVQKKYVVDRFPHSMNKPETLLFSKKSDSPTCSLPSPTPSSSGGLDDASSPTASSALGGGGGGGGCHYFYCDTAPPPPSSCNVNMDIMATTTTPWPYSSHSYVHAMSRDEHEPSFPPSYHTAMLPPPPTNFNANLRFHYYPALQQTFGVNMYQQ